MEHIDILDENGNKTGRIKPRSDVHRDGDWHKTVHIWIINDRGEILIQKRSPFKDRNPNLWDMSASGHLPAGDDSLVGALREVGEELGINLTPDDIKFLRTQKYPNVGGSAGFIDNELADIYIVRRNIDLNEIKLQDGEVSEVRFASVPEIKELILQTNPPFFKKHFRVYFEDFLKLMDGTV